MDNQHTSSELTERQKGLLTLLCDKIVDHGQMMGAHRSRNWHTKHYYDHAPEVERMQGTLDRIEKVTYHKSFLVDDKKHDMFKPCYLGPDLYKHNVRCHWKEPFGMGDPNPSDILKSMMTQDKVGNWHMPCDLGIWITLWHPSEQAFQERIHDCWDLKGGGPDWRPRYNYTDVEVKEALQIMAQTFGWGYEEGTNMETIIFRH